ncbi:MAG: tetratricopeptide repeat protein, partial [Flavobacteriaceae bacterium]|nr:tetratricopeptide repeat protein [Flavobacteriaceae bacterium]
MKRGIQNTLKTIVLLVPLFVFSQKIDSAYVFDTNNKALILKSTGSYTEALSLIDGLITKINDTQLKYLAHSLQTKAIIQQDLGKYEQSIKTSNEALNISEQLKDSFNIAFNYNLIGIGYYFLSDYERTKMYYEKSFALKKQIKVDDRQLAVNAYNLAILYEDLAQPIKALKLYKEAENYLLEDTGDKSFLTDVYVGISHLYFYRKEINKAEEYSEKAMDIGLKSYGPLSPNMTFVYNSYSNILESKGNYKEAIVLLKKSLKIRENTYGENHKWTCESNNKLAEILALDKQYDEAEKHFKRAIDIGKQTNSFQYLANAQVYLAKMYLDRDIRFNEAEKLLLAALGTNIKVFGHQNDIIAENYYLLAEVAKKTNQKDKFFAFINQVFNASVYDKNKLNAVIAPFQALES